MAYKIKLYDNKYKDKKTLNIMEESDKMERLIDLWLKNNEGRFDKTTNIINIRAKEIYGTVYGQAYYTPKFCYCDALWNEIRNRYLKVGYSDFYIAFLNEDDWCIKLQMPNVTCCDIKTVDETTE